MGIIRQTNTRVWIVWDFMRYAREVFLAGRGRGLAVGTCRYSLRITHVDPLHFRHRASRRSAATVPPPNIHIDSARPYGREVDRRHRTSTRENVAQSSRSRTPTKAKAAVRDVRTRHEMAISDVDKVAKPIRNELEMTLDSAGEEVPQLADLQKMQKSRPLSCGRSGALKGLLNNAPLASVHAAGVVVTPTPAHRLGAPPPAKDQLDHHRVGHEGNRTHRPAEDGLPRAHARWPMTPSNTSRRRQATRLI